MSGKRQNINQFTGFNNPPKTKQNKTKQIVVREGALVRASTSVSAAVESLLSESVFGLSPVFLVRFRVLTLKVFYVDWD